MRAKPDQNKQGSRKALKSLGKSENLEILICFQGGICVTATLRSGRSSLLTPKLHRGSIRSAGIGIMSFSD
ncbi:hypothetical protein KEM48_001717 [Puccinia striiformis f. sp. tritici PST-130]|nr:hypothetical protein KEM48_001717 [Puccinia striiformis f. sp. tritici PST-130]